MGWFITILPFLVFAFVVISIIRGAVKVAQKLSEQQSQQRPPATYDPAEAARTRRIQEEIRRKIAERRGGAVAPEATGRQVESRAEAAPVLSRRAPEPPVMASATAVLERQEQLAEQMRSLETARLMEQRKAATVAATKREETEQEAAVAVARGALLDDLRNPPTARRAMLLREILDRPVALR